MELGHYLETTGESAERFRTEAFVAQGRSYQIVRCADEERSEQSVAAKALLYEEERRSDDAYVEGRRGALDTEWEVLERGIDGLPEPVERIEVEAGEEEPEPVLVYGYLPGDDLYDFIASRPPGRIPVERRLEVVRRVAEVCRALHKERYVFRDLDPRHVIVDEECRFVGMVGAGNVAPVDDRPHEATLRYADAAYVAPEVRNERSGETLRPAADAYGIGALACWMLTGLEPTTSVESPLLAEAYEELKRPDIDRLDELVAALLQPVAKYRLDFETLIEHLQPDRIPTMDLEAAVDDEEFEIQPLPEPWEGAEPPETNIAARSKLSPGPLISVPNPDGGGGPDLSEVPAPSTGNDGEGEAEVEGVKSGAVREFLGESEPSGPEDVEPIGAPDEEEARTDATTGEKVREVSMVEENLGESAGQAPQESDEQEAEEGGADEENEWERRAAESPLPAFSELSGLMQAGLIVAFVIAGIALMGLLALLGVV